MAAWLRRCLDKNPSRRWRDIGDVKFEIGNDDTEEVSAEVTSRRPWGILVAGALVVAAVAAVLAWNVKPEPPRPVSRFSVYLPEDANFSFAGRRIIAFSPDGSRIAYVANRQLHLRVLDQMESVPLADTQGSRTPFFSPDGEWIGFYADNALNKVSVRGARGSVCVTQSTPSERAGRTTEPSCLGKATEASGACLLKEGSQRFSSRSRKEKRPTDPSFYLAGRFSFTRS